MSLSITVNMRPWKDGLQMAKFILDGTLDTETAPRLERELDKVFERPTHVLVFDLANLSVNHEFGVVEDGLLLAAYFGEARRADLAALRLMRFMSDFREAMWGVVQSGISELDFDFPGYAAEHFERMTRSAANPAFEKYLAVLA